MDSRPCPICHPDDPAARLGDLCPVCREEYERDMKEIDAPALTESVGAKEVCRDLR